METTIYTRQSRDEIRTLVATIPGVLAGRLPDPLGMREGLQLRVGMAFLAEVKADFVRKARGGSGADGDKWAPLTHEYLAYGRGPESTRRAGRLAPGGKDGFMTKAQLKRWRQIFAQRFRALAAQRGPEYAAGVLATEAELDARDKSAAAAMAWADAKRNGVKTKLEVFGNRPHEILRDRGILLNSLSPGVVTDAADGSASYQPPGGEGSEAQVMRAVPGELIVGTSVAYAAAHHNAKPPRKRRRLWPDRLPDAWARRIARVAASGLSRAIAAMIAEQERGAP